MEVKFIYFINIAVWNFSNYGIFFYFYFNGHKVKEGPTFLHRRKRLEADGEDGTGWGRHGVWTVADPRRIGAAPHTV
uniref:Uncharacterized protein n=1 Tax=Helianthus annuus TaxID=4232 RepID=A0A251VCA3_HELAN